LRSSPSVFAIRYESVRVGYDVIAKPPLLPHIVTQKPKHFIGLLVWIVTVNV
jgi:hypothetical protein